MITLTRTHYNKSCTIGRLTADDDSLSLVTMEARIPRGKQKYTNMLLPPGTYPMTCEKCTIMVGQEPFRTEWGLIDKVKGYTKTVLMAYTKSLVPEKGAIFLGTEELSEFELNVSDDAIIRLINYFHGKEGSPMQLVITEDPQIVYHDYSKQEYDAEQAQQQALLHQEELRQRFYNQPHADSADDADLLF